jgi:ketosteroid isomerase-like protein
VSQKNVEIVRRAFSAWNRGDIEGVLERVHPGVELLPSVVGGIEQTRFRGLEGYRRWLEEQAEIFPEISFEVTDIRSVGDLVVAVYVTRARGKGSGIVLESPGAGVFTFRDGLLVRQVGYQDPRDALEAVGLRE